MEVETDARLLADELWSELERVITALREDPNVPLFQKEPNYERGLNVDRVNELAAEAGLGSGQPVYRLHSEDVNTAFKATLELGQLRDERAVSSLATTLRTHRDYYVRLGAATALGEIKVIEGVPSLIEALDDRDELVRTAASDALGAITGETIPYRAGATEDDRKRAQASWRRWLADNDARVADR